MMKIQTTLLCGLLLSTPVFAAPINNKSSINQQVGYVALATSWVVAMPSQFKI